MRYCQSLIWVTVLGAACVSCTSEKQYARQSGGGRDSTPRSPAAHQTRQVYGKTVIVEAGGVDVCSWEYARSKNLSTPLKPVFASFAAHAGAKVPAGQVLIDVERRQAAFFRGSDAALQRVHFVPTPHKLPHAPVANGDYAYVPCCETYRGFQVVDCRDPARPRVTASLDIGCWGGEIALSGTRAYALTSYYGVTILDISDAAHPRPTGRWHLAPPANHGTRVVPLETGDKHYFYCRVTPDGNWKDWPRHPREPAAGVRLVDATDAAHPRVVTNLGTGIGLFTAIVDHTGYLAAKNRIDAYDLSRPDRPRPVGSFTARGRILATCFTPRLALAAVRGGGLVVLDTGNPGDMRLSTRLKTPGLDQASCIAVSGPAAYVLTGGPPHAYNPPPPRSGATGDLLVYDIRDQASAKFVRAVSLRQQSLLPPNALAATPGRLYALRWRWGFGLIVLDASKPFAPIPVGKCPLAGQLKSIMVDGDIGIGALKWGGMEAVLDLRDPPRAKIRSFYFGRLNDYADVFFRGRMYYGIGHQRDIIDLSDPGRPRRVGACALSGQPLTQTRRWATRGWIVERRRQGGVLAAYDYDVKAPPRPVSSLPLPKADGYIDLTVDGRRAFILGRDFILAVDITQPGQPRLLGRLAAAGIDACGRMGWELGRAHRLVHDRRGYLYVLQGSETRDDPRIKVFDVRDPAHMRQAHLTPPTVPTFSDDWLDSRILHMGDAFYDCRLRGNFLYVASYRGGLRIYDISRVEPKLVDWEFAPYLKLVPRDWSRARYAAAVKSGDVHAALGVTPEEWRQRFAIGHSIWGQDVVYAPGFDLQTFNVGAFVNGYLVHPKVCGVAVYRVRMSSEAPERAVRVRFADAMKASGRVAADTTRPSE